MSYAAHVSTRQTPQSESIPGKQQVENSAGGFAFAVDCWTRLDRFLILGNEGGSYYATERTLTKENAAAVLECAAQDAQRTVSRIVEISEQGRAPKNDPAIFALALLAGQKAAYSPAALEAMPRVCRIGTHLFQFVDALQHFRGWPRSVRRAVSRWYNEKSPEQLAYQVTKYAQRNGWTHHDILHKCHAKAETAAHNAIFGYLKNGNLSEDLPIDCAVFSVEEIKGLSGPNSVATFIRDRGLVREHVPTEHLNSPEVWDALLEKMPMTAMLRNLGKMASVGLLTPMSAACKTVCDRLADVDRLKKARIHPLSVLIAHSIYTAGHGVKGSLTWSPDSSIVDALDAAFYLAFQSVEPTGKRFYLGLDVSGSMGMGSIAGSFLTPRDASAAMAMVTVQSEQQTYSAGFTCAGRHWGSGNAMTEIALSKRMRLNEAVRTIFNLPMGGTDCALPMLDALEKGIYADVFVIYTDSETWAGNIHPCQALQQYRDKTGIPAKLIVCGMVSNGFTIADPNDAGMLDVVGFDSSVPQVIADFSR